MDPRNMQGRTWRAEARPGARHVHVWPDGERVEYWYRVDQPAELAGTYVGSVRERGGVLCDPTTGEVLHRLGARGMDALVEQLREREG